MTRAHATSDAAHPRRRGAARPGWSTCPRKDVTVRDGDARPAGSWSRPRSSRCCAAAACPRATRSRSPGSPGSRRAKRTPDLVPLCHPIAVHGVEVDLSVADDAVRHHRDGADGRPHRRRDGGADRVAVAGLTLIDMVKAVDQAAVITDVRVEEKTGGESGDWADRRGQPRRRMSERSSSRVSNRAAAGVYDDRAGPLLVEGLTELGFAVDGPEVVPDGEPVEEALRDGGRRRRTTWSSPPAAPASRPPTAPRR